MNTPDLTPPETPRRLRRFHFSALRLNRLGFTLALGLTPLALAAEPPSTGDRAPDFTLKTLENETVRLSELTAQGRIVLIVLRGWPEYQCPACDRQVQDFISQAPEFAQAGTRVVFVYPGPAENLKAHAREFRDWKGKQWPPEFVYLLDPDYSMVNAYGIRWDAPRETAYPSTFILDEERMVRFARVSRTHGGRTKAKDVLMNIR